jgi:GT2 family glycosyltransferase
VFPMVSKDITDERSVTVSIVNFNTWDDVENCVRYLRGSALTLDWALEILVWNNGDGQVPPGVVAHVDDVSVGMRNLGYGAANNRNLQRATGRYFLILNPDTRMPASAIVAMAEELQSNARTGMVAPQLRNLDGGVQRSCRRFPAVRHEIFRALCLDHLLPGRFNGLLMGNWEHDDLRLVEQPAGAALMLRTADMWRLGGFDEDFFMYFEDVDLCKRVTSEVGTIAFLPNAQVTHAGEGTASRYRRSTTRAIELSRLLYYSKHECSVIRRAVVRACVGITCVTRAVVLSFTALFSGGERSQRRERAHGYASVLPHLFDRAVSLSQVGRS